MRSVSFRTDLHRVFVSATFQRQFLDDLPLTRYPGLTLGYMLLRLREVFSQPLGTQG